MERWDPSKKPRYEGANLQVFDAQAASDAPTEALACFYENFELELARLVAEWGSMEEFLLEPDAEPAPEAVPAADDPPPAEPAGDTFYQVKIFTEGGAALAFMNGRSLGKTPVSQMVPAGRYTVRLESGKRSIERTFTVGDKHPVTTGTWNIRRDRWTLSQPSR